MLVPQRYCIGPWSRCNGFKTRWVHGFCSSLLRLCQSLSLSSVSLKQVHWGGATLQVSIKSCSAVQTGASLVEVGQQHLSARLRFGNFRQPASDFSNFWTQSIWPLAEKEAGLTIGQDKLGLHLIGQSDISLWQGFPKSNLNFLKT